MKIDVNPCSSSSSSGTGAQRQGSESISSAVSTKTVTFSSVMPSSLYAPVYSFFNSVDGSPIFLDSIVTAQSTTGFTITLGSPTDTANYIISYIAKEY